jgi:hypothetical protein
MIRSFGISLAFAAMAAAPALAQDSTLRPGTLEVTLIPAGGTFFTAKDASPDFRDYTYGGALAYNINRYVGVEGEIGGTAGSTQNLFGTIDAKTPNTFTYSGNVIASVWTGHPVVPFVAGGLGGLTMFGREALGFTDNTTFLTSNLGGGVKWYSPNGRWGVRGDYRFLAVRSKDDAPAFFGQENRFGHRVYVGVVVR